MNYVSGFSIGIVMEITRSIGDLSQWLSDAHKPITELHIDGAKCVGENEEVDCTFAFNYNEEDHILLLRNCILEIYTWRKVLEDIVRDGESEIQKVALRNFQTMNNDFAKVLASCLENLKTIRHVIISGCRLKDGHLKLLQEALFSSKTIISVNLSNNEITSEGLYAIYELLSSGSVLITLDVSNNPCKGYGGIRLLEKRVPDFICTFDED